MPDEQIELLQPFLDDFKKSGTQNLDTELEQGGKRYRVRVEVLPLASEA
jgi:hypothetical protein